MPGRAAEHETQAERPLDKDVRHPPLEGHNAVTILIAPAREPNPQPRRPRGLPPFQVLVEPKRQDRSAIAISSEDPALVDKGSRQGQFIWAVADII